MTSPRAVPTSVDATLALLAEGDYVADRSLATALFLSMRLARPLFLEGEAGVGKTEVAKVLAEALGRRLIRLQCYEGLDVSSALYEWNYAQQILQIRIWEAAGQLAGGEDCASPGQHTVRDIFTPQFLLKRPLLQAVDAPPGQAPVLLIDELDRADDEFEAFLLELLSEFQVTVPELGTLRAAQPPLVIITSNRTREIHDALKRRCFYHWVDYPDLARELEILKVKAPGASERLSRQVVGFVQELRKLDLFKAPGVAESIDWATALSELNALDLDPKTINDTLGVLLKYQDDIQRLQGSEAAEILRKVKSDIAAQGYDLSHGLEQQQLAVKSGAWPLYRFDPRRTTEHLAPLQLDSKDPTVSLASYQRIETRFHAAARLDPARYERLMAQAEREVADRWAVYRYLAGLAIPEAPPPEGPASVPDAVTVGG